MRTMFNVSIAGSSNRGSIVTAAKPNVETRPELEDYLSNFDVK